MGLACDMLLQDAGKVPVIQPPLISSRRNCSTATELSVMLDTVNEMQPASVSARADSGRFIASHRC